MEDLEQEFREEETLSKKEQKLLAREQYVKEQYNKVEGAQFLGKDSKTFYIHNPENEQLMIDACNNSGIDIEVKAFSDIYIMDCWYGKAKEFVCQLKRISGKDLTNPLLKDAKLIMYVNGDVFYSMSKARRKYHLLKELSRVLFNYEKDKYTLLKYNYQNNNIMIDKFGAYPTEDSLKTILGE